MLAPGANCPQTQNGAFVGMNLDPISSFGLSLDVFDATTEDPWVASSDALVTLGLERHDGVGRI